MKIRETLPVLVALAFVNGPAARSDETQILCDFEGSSPPKTWEYLSGDARPVNVSADSGSPVRHRFPSTGDWGSVETVSVPVTLHAGTNTVTFDSGSDYAPDIDRIDVPVSPR